MPNWFSYLSNFVDAGENLVMANDVATPSNSLVASVEKEELEEVSLDVNVSQRSREEKNVQKNGAHSSQSFGLGLLIVS